MKRNADKKVLLGLKKMYPVNYNHYDVLRSNVYTRFVFSGARCTHVFTQGGNLLIDC